MQPFAGMGPVVPPATPVVSAMPTAVPIPGQSDMSALAEILRLVIPSRQTPGEAPRTPQKRHRRPPSASDIDHFLQYLQVHPEYGVHQTPDLHAVLTEADAGPDVLADIDLSELLRSPLKLKLGTAQRLKSGARAWLAQPEERQKIPRLDLTGASSSTGVASAGPKACIVNYEWKFAQGGGRQWSGPPPRHLEHGEEPPDQKEDSVWFFDDTLGTWLEIPAGFVEQGDNDWL